MLVRASEDYGALSREFKPAYVKKIDGLIFVHPRLIPITMPEGGKISICERPLRANTAQGPRVSIARSEAVPIGSTITFEVELLQNYLHDLICEWLDYGKLRGFSQWANSGKGRFSYEILPDEKK